MNANYPNYKIDTRKIYLYILDKNLSKTQFCKLCSISYPAFVKLLQGSDRVELSVLRKIADKMGCRIKDLFE